MTTSTKGWQENLNGLIERHHWQKGGLSDFDVEMLKTFISEEMATLIEKKRQKMLGLYDTILDTDSDDIKTQKHYINMGVAYCLGALISSPADEDLQVTSEEKK